MELHPVAFILSMQVAVVISTNSRHIAPVYLARCSRCFVVLCPGPYFYLPKMQSHKEARLWNDVFIEAQDMLNIPRGTIKVLS